MVWHDLLWNAECAAKKPNVSDSEPSSWLISLCDNFKILDLGGRGDSLVGSVCFTSMGTEVQSLEPMFINKRPALGRERQVAFWGHAGQLV